MLTLLLLLLFYFMFADTFGERDDDKGRAFVECAKQK